MYRISFCQIVNRNKKRKSVFGFILFRLRDICHAEVVGFLEDTHLRAGVGGVYRAGLYEVDVAEDSRAWYTVRQVGERTEQGFVICGLTALCGHSCTCFN